MLEKRYTEDHEWVELSPDGKIGTTSKSPPPGFLLSSHTYPLRFSSSKFLAGTIGITTYASKALGDVVYIELPTVDLKVDKGDTIGAVESVKSASDIMTPISGTITEANGVLEEKPGTINKGPEGEGWFARIKVDDVKELDALMTKEQYDKHAEGGETE